MKAKGHPNLKAIDRVHTREVSVGYAKHRSGRDVSFRVPQPSTPKPITNRQCRAAKKQFKKHVQVPAGYKLEYVMSLSTGINRTTPDIVQRQWDELDAAAAKLFHKKYFGLKSIEKSKVHESLHPEGKAPRA